MHEEEDLMAFSWRVVSCNHGFGGIFDDKFGDKFGDLFDDIFDDKFDDERSRLFCLENMRFLCLPLVTQSVTSFEGAETSNFLDSELDM